LPKKSKIKRLAVQVEDHPVEYINFKGEIPKGLYGAGKVEIFDQGKFTLLEKSAKLIRFKLKGKKYSGIYNLIFIRSQKGKNLWLIFKS